VTASVAEGLPERAGVPWRARVDADVLARDAGWWTLTTVAHTVPFLLAAALLVAIKPILAPISLLLVLHAWVICELYANRGAGVLLSRAAAAAEPEARALLLLGDLVDDANRRLHDATGLILERGRLGTWVLSEAGALLVWPGGRRVNCYCVRVTGPALPHGDRIAHLLLALRCGEADFATVANVAFSGARWRVRRRLAPAQRPALAAAAVAERSRPRRRARIAVPGRRRRGTSPSPGSGGG
jgi:hypothetical protein